MDVRMVINGRTIQFALTLDLEFIADRNTGV